MIFPPMFFLMPQYPVFPSPILQLFAHTVHCIPSLSFGGSTGRLNSFLILSWPFNAISTALSGFSLIQDKQTPKAAETF